MGPSGSGKTTLLNTLAQRQTATVQGRISINGQERPLATHRAITAFVEQEDTLIGSLTVEETLEYSARLALPATATAHELRGRVQRLIEAFGLREQSKTLIGTPLQKGLSGGQKRRVSVATQLITGPKILYLDEPTSGLDSTASYEIMHFLRDFARRNRILMIASIHQPSTKTFELFDKVCLLSQGKTCFYGTMPELISFFASVDLPIPSLTNPAEHMLDVTNVDFSAQKTASQASFEKILAAWHRSPQAQQIQHLINSEQEEVRQRLLSHTASHRPSNARQVLTLMHRAFVKSYRDLTTYWIRVLMYLGLAVMMGTVWLRLSQTQEHIQPFINAIVR